MTNKTNKTLANENIGHAYKTYWVWLIMIDSYCIKISSLCWSQVYTGVEWFVLRNTPAYIELLIQNNAAWN